MHDSHFEHRKWVLRRSLQTPQGLLSEHSSPYPLRLRKSETAPSSASLSRLSTRARSGREAKASRSCSLTFGVGLYGSRYQRGTDYTIYDTGCMRVPSRFYNLLCLRVQYDHVDKKPLAEVAGSSGFMQKLCLRWYRPAGFDVQDPNFRRKITSRFPCSKKPEFMQFLQAAS